MPNEGEQITDVSEKALAAVEKVAPQGFWHDLAAQVLKPETIAGRVGSIIVILAVAAVAYGLLMAAFARTRRRLERAAAAATGPVRDRQQRAITAVSLLANVVRWVVVLLTAIWVLGEMNIDLLPVLTGLGFLGAAVAFGSQSLVKDFVSGLFLLLEGQYAVGDYVNLSGKFGLVEKIGLRVTVLRDLDNQLHHIPNGTIGAVTVYEEPYVNYVLEVPLASPEDADKVRRGLEELGAELQAEYPLHVTEISPVQVHQEAEHLALARMPLAAFPTQEWIITEELLARVQLLLGELEVQVPTGLKVRTYPDIREITGSLADQERTA